jgi:hypothetical protein
VHSPHLRMSVPCCNKCIKRKTLHGKRGLRVADDMVATVCELPGDIGGDNRRYLERSLGMASSSVRCCCSFSSRRSLANAD